MSQLKCPDCAAKIGETHSYNCDVVRCPVCKGQRLCCDCHSTIPVLWTGFWPGVLECQALGWYCVEIPGKGFQQCSADTPNAREDLNRWAMAGCPDGAQVPNGNSAGAYTPDQLVFVRVTEEVWEAYHTSHEEQNIFLGKVKEPYQGSWIDAPPMFWVHILGREAPYTFDQFELNDLKPYHDDWVGKKWEDL